MVLFYHKVHPCSRSRDRLVLPLLLAALTAATTSTRSHLCLSHTACLKVKQTLEGKEAFFYAPTIDLVYKLIIRYKNAVKLTGSCTNLVRTASF